MELSEFLTKSKNARKIFGKVELKIIEKQIRGINLTQSEKNRLSRDIREKLRFIKEVNRFSEEFDLKKGKLIKTMINEVVEVIKEDVLFRKIKKIMLFGSAVTKELTFRSDIDIAVEFEEINVKEATEFRIRVSRNLSDKMDIQVFNILPNKIKISILKNNKILYEK